MGYLVCAFYFLAQVALASVADLNYKYAQPAKGDEGNEIIQRDLNFELNIPFYTSPDKSRIYSGGLLINDTYLSFDEPKIGNFDLLKVALPVHGIFAFGNNILNATVSIGQYGQRDDFGHADTRLQGQVFYLFGTGDTKWILGGGFGDQFGETRFFPIFGGIYAFNPQSKLSLVFPQIKYEYSAKNQAVYNFTIQPVGAQWRVREGKFSSDSLEGDLVITGLQYSLGVNLKIAKNLGMYTNFGIIKDKNIEIIRVDDPDVREDVDLEDQYVIQLGFTFP